MHLTLFYDHVLIFPNVWSFSKVIWYLLCTESFMRCGVPNIFLLKYIMVNQDSPAYIEFPPPQRNELFCFSLVEINCIIATLLVYVLFE